MRYKIQVTTAIPVRRSIGMLIPLLLCPPLMAQDSGINVSAGRAEQAQVAALTIVLSGIKKQTGTVRIAIFDGPDSWLKEPTIAAVLSVKDDTAVYQRPDVPYGSYGMAVFHDANDNGQMDKTFLGLPKEAYGFSNNARAAFGPPSWRKAVVMVDEPTISLNIRLK